MHKLPFFPVFFSFIGRFCFGDWFVSDCAHHHPVSANRTFPIRGQIGPFCGHFWPLVSQIFVSEGVHTFWRWFLAPCLCIQKFRSRQPWLNRAFLRGFPTAHFPDFVSVSAHPFWWRYVGACLRIQKFRSRCPGSSRACNRNSAFCAAVIQGSLVGAAIISARG